MIRHNTLPGSPFEYVLFGVFFIILSFYIVYEQVTNCLSIGMAEQILRHKNMLAGTSAFFNPWQYRILSTYLLETVIVIFSKIPFLNHDYIPYFFLRFLQNIAIFYVAYKYYQALRLKSNYLIMLGILLLGYNMSNSVFQSDLSFNTYFDILFYLLAGYLILINREHWVILVIILAAFNRETSVLIPFMLIFSSVDFKMKKVMNIKRFKTGIYSLLIFVIIFVGLRIYYGMPPAQGIHGMTSPIDFLKFNLSFFKLYPLLFGTLGIIPLIVIIKFKSLNHFLKLLLLLIVPVWFIVHLLKSTVVETRLFLVPQALIFVPAILFIIEKEFKERLQRVP